MTEDTTGEVEWDVRRRQWSSRHGRRTGSERRDFQPVSVPGGASRTD